MPAKGAPRRPPPAKKPARQRLPAARPPKLTLSFLATLESANPDDRLREFVLNFSVEDSAFQVAERAVRNSGFPGGRFINATRALNPATGRPYRADEVALGGDVVVNGWRFRLREASEATLRAMEAHPERFPRADVGAVLQSLRGALRGRAGEIRAELERFDPERHGTVETGRVIDALAQRGVRLGEQELLAVYRQYAFGDTCLFCYPEFLEHFRE
jgi:hypothetical protein